MAQTITSGILAQDRTTIRPVGSITWAALDSSPYSTWENWLSWTEEPANIVVVETIDTGASDYYVPQAEILTEGNLTVTVKVSDTGLFAGEETSYQFATEDVGEKLIKGRYIRWTFTVAPNASSPVPYLQYFAQANNSLVEVFLDDIAVPSLPTDSLGFRLITHPLGAVKNVQATTLQGDDYVDNGYYLLYEQLEPYLRTSNTSLITSTGITYSTNVPYPRHLQSARFDNPNDVIYVANTDNRIVDANNDFTLEFWFNTDDFDFTGDEGSDEFRVITTLDKLSELNQGQVTIFLIKQADNQKIYLQWLITQLPSGSTTRTHTVEIVPGQWYHFSISIENGIYVESYLNGGDGIAPTLSSAFATPDRIIIGNGQIIDSVFIDYFEGYISEYRISNIVRYPEPYNINTVFSPFVSDQYTTLLLHFDGSIEDDTLVRTGTEDYTYRQNGGTAVVESKNPLALKVVDYNGDAWDGAVDLHLRGLPQVARLGNSIVQKFD